MPASVASQRRSSPRHWNCSAFSSSPARITTTPNVSAVPSTSSGWLSGWIHSAGITSSRANTLPNAKPKAIAAMPPGISSRSAGSRWRSANPAIATMSPCTTSPNMKPNISGATNAITMLGSASRVPGIPISPPNTSNGRAQAGLRSTEGGIASSGAGVLRSR